MCDDHPDRPAIARIQGETDSFGCEYWDVCQECLDGIRARNRSPEARTGRCDWCKQHATDLCHTRDYEEGLAGPVYRVCRECIRRRNERVAEEEEMLGGSGFYDDWDDGGDDDYEPEPYEPDPADVFPAVRKVVVLCKACRKPWDARHKCPAAKIKQRLLKTGA